MPKSLNLNFELKNCEEKYWEFVRTLRNDKRVQTGFISSVEITEEMQKKYMSLNSKFYRIAIVNGDPAGYVGVIDDDIRICTHPKFQGLGVGKFLIQNCINIWPSSFAKVKLDNEASLKLFESCGFVKKFYILERE